MAEKKTTPVSKRLDYKAMAEGLTEALEVANDRNKLLDNTNALLNRRIGAFDEILNKIERASYGHAIYYGQSAGAVGGAVGVGQDYPEVRAMPSLSRNERAEQREAQLHKDVRVLSSQITAVNSIVQFAREHKA